MENSVVGLIQKLPDWYLMIILPIACYLFLTRVKRDKNGKLYWYREDYENKKKDRKQDEVKNLILSHIESDESFKKEVILENLKQTFFITQTPTPEKIIAGLRYVKAGGNGDVKKRLFFLIKENQEIYDGIIASNPKLKVEVDKIV